MFISQFAATVHCQIYGPWPGDISVGGCGGEPVRTTTFVCLCVCDRDIFPGQYLNLGVLACSW